MMLIIRRRVTDGCCGVGWGAEEEDLWRRLLEETNVNLTPGRVMHCPKPGLFRLCFAYVSLWGLGFRV